MNKRSSPNVPRDDSQITQAPAIKKIISIDPGTNIQGFIDHHPVGSTFLIKKGIHRLQRIIPKSGNTFLGENGSILSGARLLTEFSKEGKYWVVIDQTQQGQVHGKCQKQSNGNQETSCRYPEDLFRDDVSLSQVTSFSELTSNKWFFDYDHDKIYLADNPSEHKIETSVIRHAFAGAASNVTIRGLIIEKYANPAQHGAIHAKNGTKGPLSTNWRVEGCEIRFNHGAGIHSGNQAKIITNHIHHNGQIGVRGSGTGVLIAGNEIAYNNTLRFQPYWEAGGTKFLQTNGLIVRDNLIHHNYGVGLWTDYDNIDTTYEGNRVLGNDRAGIFHEISYKAKIRNNYVEANGFGFTKWLWGAGILIAGSPDVEVYGNTIHKNAAGIGAIQQARGTGRFGPYVLENLYVHDNVIMMPNGETGMVQDTGDTSCFTIRNNRFESNTYFFDGSRKHVFRWMNSLLTATQWKAYGLDTKAKFLSYSHSRK